MESGDERRGSWQEEEHLLYEGVSNGPIQFKSARKIWPLLELLHHKLLSRARKTPARMLGFWSLAAFSFFSWIETAFRHLWASSH